ncbi:MAG: class II glutamine amidotransferase [Planctomycetota bacterium]|jgi:ergothioneine biosynthesis protein EgtC|nr:class II glutamine amidotransferase [Planctomycetota bacterium]
MCRFVAYLGPTIRLDRLVTLPVHSLIHQSYESQERSEPLNGDGFGVGWYVPALDSVPATFRSITPAWNNPNLIDLARVTESPCIFAHIRAASPGLPVTETNCHPFRSESLLFMHNGSIPGFSEVRRKLLSGLSDRAFKGIVGTTDSEVLFALFRDRFAPSSGGESLESMAEALRETISYTVEVVRRVGVDRACQLNLAVTDGVRAVVSRFSDRPQVSPNSLYLHAGKRYVYEEGRCRMLEADIDESTVLVSSERLSEDAGWESVPENHLVLIPEDHQIEFRPIPE